MNARTLKTHALPALLAGTARQPLGFDRELAELAHGDAGGATLSALSLTGQALRFERPQPPPSFIAEASIEDRRPILADRMRRPLIRLLHGRRPSDDVALALAWAFGRAKVRPHPFDLPKIDAFARAHAEHLGLTAQHWAEQQESGSPAEMRGYFDADKMDDGTWTKAAPAQRARYIAERRKLDATAARALVEAAWPQENADARLRLLMALEAGLSADDVPFLESLEKDRAPRVRSLAQRFLARVSGGRGQHPALVACLERIRRTATGLLKKRAVLTLELPVTVKEHEARAWIRDTFAEVSCDELAGALDLTAPAMIDAAEKDANLSLAFALMATSDRRFDLLEQLTRGQLGDAWEQMSQCGPADLGSLTDEERLRWAAILIRPCAAEPPASYAAWSWLHRALEGPAPEPLIEAVLKSPRWLSRLLEEHKMVPEGMEILAALCPDSHRERLRALMMPLDAPVTLTAMPLLDILDSITKVGNS
jgi:Family of unknown function (DUF5691)